MSDPKVVYTLAVVEDAYGTGRQHVAYKVQVGRRGSPAEIAAELRMAADALEGHFAEVSTP
jgi:hypothetical protein